MDKITINRFKCSYCDKEFDTAEECEHHENQHAFPTEILNVDFYGQGRYPCLIQVKFDDGNTVDYIRNDGTRIYTNVYGDAAWQYANNTAATFVPNIIWHKVNVIVSKVKAEFFGYWNRENDMTFETLIEKKYREQWVSVGDKIYKCEFDEDKGKDVVETYRVYGVTYVDDVKAYNCEGCIKGNTTYTLFKKHQIGVSVFLTKRDAQRLANKRNENIIR